MSILSNGATIIIAVLLVLAIGYRYYSAFLAAKVLALDPLRSTPAHDLKDGHNYHPTNKWVLFGHHFAAISGAGPLIGPVLAAQFGYLPGLLWILIGVVLAGAVQDFVVLTLSMRRGGKSLAQIAYSEMGAASGTAATIGILFVLVIALAGLGKVVTVALGGESVKYDPGTEFRAVNNSLITQSDAGGTVYTYQLPTGTQIKYPNGAVKTASAPMTIEAEAPRGTAVSIEVREVPRGRLLRIRPGQIVTRDDDPRTTYPIATDFIAPAAADITSTFTGNAFHYTIPAGTTIVLRDQSNKPIVLDKEIKITQRMAEIQGTRGPNLPELNLGLGAEATRVPPAGQPVPAQPDVYSTETLFQAPNGRPITALGLRDNAYRFRIPQGTHIFRPNRGAGAGRTDEVATADFEIVTRPADSMITYEPGHLLRVPTNTVTNVHEEIPGSSWGTFTIFLTIPIALLVGIYLYRIRKNRVLEASIIGGILTLGAVYLGGQLNSEGSWLYDLKDTFNLSAKSIGLSMAVYGFVAAVLPVWMLLCPRDYLSSFLKIGTIALLILGVIVAHPALRAPAINGAFLSSGPVLGNSPIFPFVFITIMCGAISGFHALVASGTTPKMISNETHARPIGYGAMLMEGLVGIVALIAAAAMPVQHYYEINTPPANVPTYQTQMNQLAQNDRLANNLRDFEEPLPDVGEHVQGRTGGAVTLAVGMANILNGAVTNLLGRPEKPPGWLSGLYSYWYHFAIMFEALFILTTIDTGTRVGRFLLQETMGKWITPSLGKADNWFSAILATALISAGWWYFLHFNAFNAIWAMFGIANQMLAVMALAIASAALSKNGKRKYLAVTVIPMLFVALTTTSAAVLKIREYIGAIRSGKPAFNPALSAICVVAILMCTAIVVGGAIEQIMRKRTLPAEVPTA